MPGTSACDWEGITCNESGKVVGMAFPLMGIKDDNLFRPFFVKEDKGRVFLPMG